MKANLKIEMLKLVAVILFTGWLLAGCRSTKTIQTAINKKDTVEVVVVNPNNRVDSAEVIGNILKKINDHKIDFKTMNAKIKLDYTDQSGKSQGATAFVRMSKDEVIWISLTGALGVEGFRAYINPDSVWVMDKLEKTISQRSIASLQEITNLPITFYELQDILVGNPVYFSSNIVSYKTEGNKIAALSIGQFFKHLLTMDTTQNLYLSSKMDDIEENRNRTCHISLNGYQNIQNRMFSTERHITVSEKAVLDIQLDYKQVTFDEEQTFPFNVPKSYKVK